MGKEKGKLISVSLEELRSLPSLLDVSPGFQRRLFSFPAQMLQPSDVSRTEAISCVCLVLNLLPRSKLASDLASDHMTYAAV